MPGVTYHMSLFFLFFLHYKKGKRKKKLVGGWALINPATPSCNIKNIYIYMFLLFKKKSSYLVDG